MAPFSVRVTGALLAAAALVAAGAAVVPPAAGADASGAGATLTPLSGTYRLCDFTEARFVAAIGNGSGFALIDSDGGAVNAEVQLGVAQPGTAYTVRLIQAPRPASRPCLPGDPGVNTAVLHTDANGTGTVTVHGGREPGATGAWVFITGPPPPGSVHGEYYTSDLIAALG